MKDITLLLDTVHNDSYNNSNESIPGIDGEIFSSITCFGCQFKGHYKDKCPYATQTGIVSMYVGYTFTQGGLFNIPKSWLLLDTCSTCDVSNNPKLVTNICRWKPEDSLTTYTNGGA